MSVAQITELSAESQKSFKDAIEKVMTRANKTLENVLSAWVKEQSVTVDEGHISKYRADLKITFTGDD